MSGLSSMMKGGWHPKSKDGSGKESWRSDFKGVNQVAGWMGKGKTPGDAAGEADNSSTRSSAPLSTLKDPASFGPPPKHIAYHGPEAVAASTVSSSAARPRPDPVPPRNVAAEPQWQAAGHEPEQHQKTAPSVPYSANTTGLSTEGLPEPPVRRDQLKSPQGAVRTVPPKPAPPPRLPPRQNSNPSTYAPEPPPTYVAAVQDDASQQHGYISEGATNRLGRAGVSVPGFGIGEGRQASPPSTQAAAPRSQGQMNELQSRFARLNKTPGSTEQATTTSQGTTWAQKQAALKTATDFRKDPSSISMSDAREAASTASNFQQRHGEQVASGWKAANGLNQRYGVTNKFQGLQSDSGQATTEASISPAGPAAGKKAPPPPPPKKKQLQSAETGSEAGAPPPIPLASKPK